MEYILAPSVLSADFENLGDDVRAAVEGGALWIHYDVMDGLFVPSISFGMPVLKAVRKMTTAILDVHLMIVQPERYIRTFADCGADYLTVHAEACTHLDSVIDQIHQAGMKVGVALNPATSLDHLTYVLQKIDMVLLMTVNPGFGGQSYIPAMTEKIATLRRMAPNLPIEVDGGINEKTLKTVLDAGANVIVEGSAVFGHGDTKERTQKVIKTLTQYGK